LIRSVNDGFFCLAPWNSMYYHLDKASPCHIIREVTLSPSEYLESDWLKNLKQDFIDGKVPKSCMRCKERDDLGLKSTRKATFNNKHLANQEYTMDRKTEIKRLELRTTNLCNFKCRMCGPDSSSEIAGKVDYAHNSIIEELKRISINNIDMVCFTGGEPMLIKQYYEFMDLLIEKKLNDQICIELFTNCSVYNPMFMDRLLQFKNISFVMSIDGVGKTAEYIRHGTNWDIVEKNAYRFSEIISGSLKKLFFNTAISSYVLLDVSSLAKFLMKLYSINDNIQTRCYSVISPEWLHFLNLNSELRKRVINEIDTAVNILDVKNFDIFTKELKGMKAQLETADYRDPIGFARNTLLLDKQRNESFEDVFGYKLY